VADVKIGLQKGETPDQAEELIFKAFQAQRDGSIHKEEFHDPAMRDLLARMHQLHADQLKELINEIGDILEAEYVGDGNVE
jgi:hypothetical protein